jgi:hypothetical protein
VSLRRTQANKLVVPGGASTFAAASAAWFESSASCFLSKAIRIGFSSVSTSSTPIVERDGLVRNRNCLACTDRGSSLLVICTFLLQGNQWVSLDALKNWYNSADYQAALKIGQKYATFRRCAVEGH